LNFLGFPAVAARNSEQANRCWIDQEHAHWYGMTDYYFLTGDESVKDAILNGPKDRFLNGLIQSNNGRLWNTRAVGIDLLGATRLYEFLSATGDPDAKTLLTITDHVLDLQVFPDLKVSGFGKAESGVSRVRGVHHGCCSTAKFGMLADQREAQPFQHSILIEGLWEYAHTRGRTWPRYWDVLDLADGLAEWCLREVYIDTGQWPSSGFRYIIALDVPNANLGEFETQEQQRKSVGMLWSQIIWFPFLLVHDYSANVPWRQRFEEMLKRNDAEDGMDWPEYGIFSVSNLVGKLLNQEGERLVDVPFSMKNDASGTYTLSWTVPKGALSYRIKWSDKRIVDSLQFDPMRGGFLLDAYTNVPWFAAPSVKDPPEPLAPGATQQIVMEGFDTGRPWYFSLKAFVHAH
jgi:hypothetical protein